MVLEPKLRYLCRLETKEYNLRSFDDEWGGKKSRVRKIELGDNGHLSWPTLQQRSKGNQALGSGLLSGQREPSNDI